MREKKTRRRYTLEDRQAVAEQVAFAPSIKAASIETGINDRTIGRWLKQKDFKAMVKAAIDRRQEIAVESAPDGATPLEEAAWILREGLRQLRNILEANASRMPENRFLSPLQLVTIIREMARAINELKGIPNVRVQQVSSLLDELEGKSIEELREHHDYLVAQIAEAEQAVENPEQLEGRYN